MVYMYYACVCVCKCLRRRKINNRIICSLDDILCMFLLYILLLCARGNILESMKRINRSSIDRR